MDRPDLHSLRSPNASVLPRFARIHYRPPILYLRRPARVRLFKLVGTILASSTFCRFLAYVLLSGAASGYRTLTSPSFLDWVGSGPASPPGRSFFFGACHRCPTNLDDSCSASATQRENLGGSGFEFLPRVVRLAAMSVARIHHREDVSKCGLAAEPGRASCIPRVLGV